METYICKKGDALSRIARENRVSADSLRTVNSLWGHERLCEGLGIWLPDQKKAGKLELMACIDGSFPYPLSFAATAPCSLSGSLVPPPLSPPEKAPLLLSVCGTDEHGCFSPGLTHSFLLTDGLAESISLAARGYDGVFLSVNYVFHFDRALFSAFLGDLSERLHKAGQYLICALAPKEREGELSPAAAGLDYALCGKLCDRLVLLCYDYAHPESPPGAVAPYERLRRCLDYAAETVGPEKLLPGLSHLGCSWTLPWRAGDTGQRLTCSRAKELALSQNASIAYDRQARSPFFTCVDPSGERSVVYFEDARSISEKLRLFAQYSTAGIFLRSTRFEAPFLQDCETEIFC